MLAIYNVTFTYQFNKSQNIAYVFLAHCKTKFIKTLNEKLRFNVNLICFF